ncbi:MAG: RsmB/NOP family class I SAM-dependent RNA methyltransferase [Holosporales bacterium]|jgi:16S rRNA (cytosine967-C5)-methyltransferase|nr:RsmB/NOP family class I SAM-dependent RNA methyltransferase [Holosporales bacterium]
MKTDISKQNRFLEQSLIDLINLVLKNKNIPADKIFQNFCKKYKIGSKNRNDLSETFFDFLRNFWKCVHIATNEANLRTDQSCDLDVLFTQSTSLPRKLLAAFYQLCQCNTRSFPMWAQANMHQDIWMLFKELFPNEQAAIDASTRVSTTVDIRVNTFTGITKSSVIQKLCAHGMMVDELPFDGLRLYKRYALQNLQLYKSGAFEIQDFTSQLVSYLCGAKSGMHILDYCAGCGGKAIAMLNNSCGKAFITLTDIDVSRLEIARKRISRLNNIVSDVRFEDINNISSKFDIVVVDAPCTGFGTIQRNPGKTVHLRALDVCRYAKTQSDILQKASHYVKSGGRLVYITCSPLALENEDVVEPFIQRNSNFKFVNPNEFLCQIPNVLVCQTALECGLRISNSFFFSAITL